MEKGKDERKSIEGVRMLIRGYVLPLIGEMGDLGHDRG